MQGYDATEMRTLADRLEKIASGKLTPGRLKGLLFGSPKRFLTDLALQLRYQASREEFCDASENNRAVQKPLTHFVEAAEAWQHQHGFENMWWDSRMQQALRKLNAPALNAVMDIRHEAPTPSPGKTTFEQVRSNFATIETYTPRLLEAMKTALHT